MGTIVLLDLMGGVALLLWGLHMVHSGILRAFGSDLRRLAATAVSNRFAAFGAGLLLTTVLQSSTATALMTSSFASRGLIGLVPALALMLGANVGTTLIVQLLSFNIAAVAPALFVIGFVTFRFGGGSRARDLGRVAIGLGLMLVALHILLDTLAPAENAPAVRALFAAVTGDPVLCILLAAALTWAAHSSVAVILLVMSLAYADFVTPAAALALVLGANLGTAINPLVESTSRSDPASLRLPLGNLSNRLVGIVVVVPLLQPITHFASLLQPDPAKMTAEFHMAFNIALALAFIGPLNAMAWLLQRLVPDRTQTVSESDPRYLDDSALASPALALADAARETLRMGDIVETMLRQVMTALRTNDRRLVAEVAHMDNIVDRLNEAIKLYLTRLTRGSLDEPEAHRAMEIISFAINLEHVGDIIDKNLSELVGKKIKRNYRFSEEGAEEIDAFYRRVLDSLTLSFSVFMQSDAVRARQLIEEKAELRRYELAAAERHLGRLREGRPETLETTSLHLDVLRDLKRVHSHICSVAYPVLKNANKIGTEAIAHGAAAAPPAAHPLLR